jgi:hypothetical protein
MLIDTTAIMYRTFLSCRHATLDTGSSLNLLAELIGLVKQQGTLAVELPDHWLDSPDKEKQALVENPSKVKLAENSALSTQNQILFSLIDIGVHELQRLWQAESKLAVRSLGYAFHILPQLLRKPEEFDPERFMFCFRIVCKHWGELSLELQKAFCEVMGLTLDQVTTLVATDDFPIQMWRSSAKNEDK